MSFESFLCIVTNSFDNSTIVIENRQGNIYMIDLNDITSTNHCLVVDNAQSNELSWLWHKRLRHISFHLIDKLIKKDLVVEISHISFNKDKICDVC